MKLPVPEGPLPLSGDEVRESCGVFGVFAPGANVARLTFFGLYALQHRGQESAGIASCNGETAHIHKANGLVSHVFDEENLRGLSGHMAIGHNRYSTTGAPKVRNAQPYLIETALGPLGIAHNGNLTNAAVLRRELLYRGVGLISSSDTEVVTQLLAGAPGDAWRERIEGFLALAEGAYSLTILTQRAVYGVRDPWGFRPLSVGRLDGDGWVIASESCALTTVGAKDIREVEPGQIVRLNNDGLTTWQGVKPKERSLCIFEYIYFARPDSLLEGRSIHQVRRRLGEQLAREHPVDADMVIGVPDSATAHAIGYAHQAGIPFGEVLIKNRYIGRTFIQPDDRLRRRGVALKFNPLPDLQGRGKRIIMVDDSIVRGNTSPAIVKLLREAGAAEVHMRVASPPIRHPCFMGVDMSTHSELIAANKSVSQIAEHLQVDSLGYLSVDGLLEAVDAGGRGYCDACFTGRYPLPAIAGIGKDMFET